MTTPISGPRPLELARELANTRRTETSPLGGAAGGAQGAAGAPRTEGTTQSPFAQALSEFTQDVNTSQRTAETAGRDFADGRSDDIHGTMIKLQEADLKLRLLGNVRNRALEAYREIMRMGA